MSDFFKCLHKKYPIYMYDPLMHKKEKILRHIPKLYLIFNDENIIILDPIEYKIKNVQENKDNVNYIDYKEIFQIIFEENPNFKGWDEKNQNFNFEWLKNRLIVSISHCHFDHWMGLTNSTFPLISNYNNSPGVISLILPKEAYEDIKNIKNYFQKEDDILKKIFNTDFLSTIREICENYLGDYCVLNSYYEPEFPFSNIFKVNMVNENFKYKCCYWKAHKIHGGQGLSLKIFSKNEKYAIYLFDLYPPYIPIATTVHPFNNLNELIKLYIKLKKEIKKNRVEIIFWSHYGENFGKNFLLDTDNNFKIFKKTTKNFIKVVKKIENKIKKQSMIFNKVELFRFCKTMGVLCLKHLFPNLKGVSKKFEDEFIFFFQHCLTSKMQFDMSINQGQIFKKSKINVITRLQKYQRVQISKAQKARHHKPQEVQFSKAQEIRLNKFEGFQHQTFYPVIISIFLVLNIIFNNNKIDINNIR